MAGTVTAAAIVVIDDNGVQHLLKQGAELPEWVDKDKVKELAAANLVEVKRAGRRSTSKTASDGKGSASESSDETKASDGSDQKEE